MAVNIRQLFPLQQAKVRRSQLARYLSLDGGRYLIECIERDARPVITPEHAFHVLEIMLKTMESGRTGQALPIESTFVPPRFPDADLLDHGAHVAHDPGRVE